MNKLTITESSIPNFTRCLHLGLTSSLSSQDDPEKRLLFNLAAQNHLKCSIDAQEVVLTKQTSHDFLENTLYTNVTIHSDNLSSKQCILQKKDNHFILYEGSCSYNPQREDLDKLALQYSILKKLWIPVLNVIIFAVNKAPKKKTKPYHFIKSMSVLTRVKRISKKLESKVFSKCVNDVQKYCDKHCFKPKLCTQFESCWPDHTNWDIFKLTQLSLEKKLDYFNKKIISFSQLKETLPELKDAQINQIKVETTQKPYVNKEQLNQFFKQLSPTYHCLDIEVLQLAIPLFTPLKAFQKLPILYSIHTYDHHSKSIQHHDNLFVPKTDFRYEFTCQLIKYLDTPNKIVVFDSTLEKQILTELSVLFPKLKPKLTKIKESFLDLAPLFINHHIMLPGMNGKASLKAVLPCITSSLSYTKLSVQSGLDVVKTYKHIAFNTQFNNQDLSKKLRDYCALDTLALIQIIDYLKKITK